MKVGKALLLVMQRWQITKYRLSKVSGVVETTVGKLVNGDLESTAWDKVEKLANGLEKLDPLAKAAFIAALQLPDSTYPSLSDNTIDLFWVRELSENIAAVMAVLDEYKLLDRENIKKLQAKLAENDAESNAIMPTTVEDFLGSRMAQIRRKQDGSTQDA
ncbi:MAG: hypothetical protein CLLPBCKN_004579 [Chroococcidiopsis cubana SAG 39.79]|uniref:HTH cro/C1-type domain-containing protein n=1 Tax=Chroococcidiopsis cubana SAG 39.79 TaxID=388085 RepID=A0AB37U9B5_9CYAN|nr:hypothetical protein [Chroococcidiopsis cubana]MDZ4875183.1 hypothetical protein [Chroococcidiopsis cubana SAG 39.79]PSB61518.1 hypothetical protein C7B79_21720 [Chroococcidiopsis cubana CCALA 043]RUS99273.1 hypothetical protein DSM107010_68710 [Chroococcidiopsis cubana SAG 39.79]